MMDMKKKIPGRRFEIKDSRRYRFPVSLFLMQVQLWIVLMLRLHY